MKLIKQIFLLLFFLFSTQYAYACISDNKTTCRLDSDCCVQDNLVCLSQSRTCVHPLNAQCLTNNQLGGQWVGPDGGQRKCPSNQYCISQSGGSNLIPCFAPTPIPTLIPTLAPCNSPAFCSLNNCPSGFHRDALQFDCPPAVNPDFQTYCCVPNSVPTLTPAPTLPPCPAPGQCLSACDGGVNGLNTDY